MTTETEKKITSYEWADNYTEKDIGRILIEDSLMCDGHHRREVRIIGFILNREKTHKLAVIEDVKTGEKEVFYSGELNHTRLLEVENDN